MSNSNTTWELLSMRMVLFWLISLSISNTLSAAPSYNRYCPKGMTPYRPYTCVSNYYVDAANGKDSNDGKEASSAWQTLDRADHGRVGGDCIHVAPGTYYQAGKSYYGLTLRSGGNANSPTGYVTWISTIPYAAKITGSSAHTSLVGVYKAAYIIFEGFEIDATGLPGNGFVADTPDHSNHHIMVLNNIIHDAGGAGISMNLSEFYTIYGNVVYNNQYTNPARSSGISIWEPEIASYTPTEADNTSYYHILIMNNVSHHNIYKVPNVHHSDANGIIIDDFLHTQRTPHTPYQGRTLVQNNLIFENGGKGIEIFYSQNVDVYNNTAYENGQDVLMEEKLRGEINIACSINVNVIGNIGYAISDANDYRKYNTAFGSMQIYGCAHNVTFEKNIAYPALAAEQFPAPDDFANFASHNLNGTNPLIHAPNDFVPNNVDAIGASVTNPNASQKALCGGRMASPPNIGAY
jgi:parallel beta-helix repeat protein